MTFGVKKGYKYIFVLKKGVTLLFVSFFMTAFMLCALKSTENCIFPCLFFSWSPPLSCFSKIETVRYLLHPQYCK